MHASAGLAAEREREGLLKLGLVPPSGSGPLGITVGWEEERTVESMKALLLK